MINQQMQIQGMYTIKKYCAETGKLKETLGPFCNKITNLGMDRLGADGRVTQYCYVGTGTAPSTITDTAMGTFKVASAAITETESRSSVAPYWHQRTRTFRFANGVINGNITEVGVGWINTSTNGLWSRELIVDTAGNPITLTVLANEFLDVIYTLRFYPLVTDFTGSVVINGTTYNYTGRTANINSASVTYQGGTAAARVNRAYNGPAVLGPLTGSIASSTTSVAVSGVYSELAYTPGSYSITSTTAMALTTANLAGGIKAIQLSGSNNVGSTLNQEWQIVFNNPIPKTADNTFGLSIRISWARYTGTIVP